MPQGPEKSRAKTGKGNSGERKPDVNNSPPKRLYIHRRDKNKSLEKQSQVV
jgi:hypothetical protein